ncbi:MAG: spermidine/putrescine ABC transporter substrate-binding protein [Nitrospirota bacterium]|nr:spermidine/putrescine ABC transporter substrate-binding protein [Nitrospirota bacterium]
MNLSKHQLPWKVVQGLLLSAAVVLVVYQQWPGDGPTTGTSDKPGGRPPTTLHYFTWSDYTDKELIRAFEREAGVKVVVDTFGSNEELLAKLESGAGGYDVVVPSDFMVAIMAKQDLLAELDLSLIPNVRFVFERLQHLPFDPDNRYSIPYLWGTVGIGYDSAVVPVPPDSWEVLWDPRYRRKISMLNDQREVFGVALRTLGHSGNATDPAVIDRAKAKLVRQKDLVKTYTSENYQQLLAYGDVVLAHGWGGTVARAMAERPSIRYVIPKEGATIWADCLVVLKASLHKDLAMRFINYLLNRDVAARTTNRLLFATSNWEAKALVQAEYRDNPAIYPPDSVLDRLEWTIDVGEAARLYDRAWTEVKLQ